METLVAAFVHAVVILGGFIITPPPPQIVEFSEPELRKICGIDNAKGILHGCFIPEMPEYLFLNKNSTDAGFLLHEVVHYVQHANGRHREGLLGMNGCEVWLFNELQAFNIQEKWLEAHGLEFRNASATREYYRSICGV